MEFLFWISLGLIFYVYFGYPVIVRVWAALCPIAVRKDAVSPRISILIAAYNEAAVIEATIRNKLQLDYPEMMREIIVVSDGSTDGTDELVGQFQGQNVRLIRQEPRAGKTAALNLAVMAATGDILVFSDANSLYAQDALRHLVSNFADPQVGYVTGKMVYVNEDGTLVGDGCSAYMRYENALRAAESGIGSIVGVDGGIDAVRKSLYRLMRPDQLPDFVLPLAVVEQGYRVIYEPRALLEEAALQKGTDEYRMRVRVSLRALWALKDMAHLLSARRYGRFAWQLWSHKVLRYLCFVFLIAAYVSNAALWGSGGFYRGTFLTQNFLYACALCAPWMNRAGAGGRIAYLAHYFALLNVASGHAFLRFVAGKKQVLWTPRKG